MARVVDLWKNSKNKQVNMHFKKFNKTECINIGANSSDIRNQHEAETQTNRINNMPRPTNFRDVFVQQSTKPSTPSQSTEESSEIFHQEPQNEEENKASPADPHVFIGEESRASPVDTTYEVKVEELTLEAFLAQQRLELGHRKC